jgi:predicted kinase
MRNLFLMCGIAFSGKSTLAKTIAARTGCAVISLDAINAERGLGLNGGSVSNEEWEETHRRALAAMSHAMSSGETLLIDDTNCFRWIRDRFRVHAEAFGYKTTIIHVGIDPELARDRLIRNERNPSRTKLPIRDFENHVRTFEPPALDENILLFEHGMDPEVWFRTLESVFPRMDHRTRR